MNEHLSRDEAYNFLLEAQLHASMARTTASERSL
jgi:hypothetical protein